MHTRIKIIIRVLGANLSQNFRSIESQMIQTLYRSSTELMIILRLRVLLVEIKFNLYDYHDKVAASSIKYPPYSFSSIALYDLENNLNYTYKFNKYEFFIVKYHFEI